MEGREDGEEEDDEGEDAFVAAELGDRHAKDEDEGREERGDEGGVGGEEGAFFGVGKGEEGEAGQKKGSARVVKGERG